MAAKLNDPKQLKSASSWDKAHLNSMNIKFTNANESTELFEKISQIDQLIASYQHLLIKDYDEPTIVYLKQNLAKYNELNEREKLIALLVKEAIYANKSRYNESNVDNFVNKLLNDMHFFSYPLFVKLQPKLFFDIMGREKSIEAIPDFCVNSMVNEQQILAIDEDKLEYNANIVNQYRECQVAAELLSAAFVNYSNGIEKDQNIYGLRVIATKFTFYKTLISVGYLQSLSNGFPPENQCINVIRFPSDTDKRQGYDYLNVNERRLIIEMLLRMREEIKKLAV